jgi:DNA-binding LacI/PurR family transcriptional regulator
VASNPGRPDGKGRQRATITDVAKLAGVSLQSVSNVLNDRTQGRMTPTTQARIWDAMRKLDYHPDARAARLRRRRAQAIAVTVLDPSPRFLADAFTAEMLSGAAHRAEQLGYRVLVTGGASAADERSVVNILRSGEADGMIVLPAGASEDWLRLLSALSESRRPFVVVQSQIELPTPGIPTGGSVSANEFDGGVSLAELLLYHGHRNTAFLTTLVSWPAVERRFAGICSALRAAGAPQPELITASDWTVDAGAVAVDAFLDAVTSRPTAIFGANDVLAGGALVAARRHGLRVPEDLSVVGFDDLDMAVALSPALTTVRVPGFEMGEAAAADVIDRVENPDEVEPRPRSFVTSAVLRGSHGPARATT